MYRWPFEHLEFHIQFRITLLSLRHYILLGDLESKFLCLFNTVFHLAMSCVSVDHVTHSLQGPHVGQRVEGR